MHDEFQKMSFGRARARKNIKNNCFFIEPVHSFGWHRKFWSKMPMLFRSSDQTCPCSSDQTCPCSSDLEIEHDRALQIEHARALQIEHAHALQIFRSNMHMLFRSNMPMLFRSSDRCLHVLEIRIIWYYVYCSKLFKLSQNFPLCLFNLLIWIFSRTIDIWLNLVETAKHRSYTGGPGVNH